MIKYECDMCGEECKRIKYSLPIYGLYFITDSEEGPVYGYRRRKYYLCEECCEKICNFVKNEKRGDVNE